MRNVAEFPAFKKYSILIASITLANTLWCLYIHSFHWQKSVVDVILVHGMMGGAAWTWRQNDCMKHLPILSQDLRRQILNNSGMYCTQASGRMLDLRVR